MAVTRKDSKVVREKARELKERFQSAESMEELAEIREEFFNLPYDYEYLEKVWDFIDGFDVDKPNTRCKRVNLPILEIIDMHEDGLSCLKIAEIFSTSYHTIQRRLLQYYEGGKEC